MIACDACEPNTACPKHPRYPDDDDHRWRKIGIIAGFCDICHKSMFGYERYEIGEYPKISEHKSCLDEFLETEEGINWNREEKEEERKAEELKREEKRLAEKKERQKQEEIKNLIGFKTFNDPFDSSNPLHSFMKFKHYSAYLDKDRRCWIIYVTKDVADRLIAEQNRLEKEKRKAAEREQRGIRRRKIVGR